jgi:glycine cleavage system H lipoate-binding protein
MVVILVLLTFASFILIDIALEVRARKRIEQMAMDTSHGGNFVPPNLMPDVDGYALPEGVLLHPGHTWAHLTLSGEAKVGIDDFARRIIGKIDRVELPDRGARVLQGGRVFTLVQGKRRINFVSPIDGVICSANEDFTADPEKSMRDPYRSGWILQIRPTDLLQNARRLRIGAEAFRWFENELEKFSEFFAYYMGKPQEVGVTAQDGGMYISGLVEDMDDELFLKFTKVFLKS